MSNYFNQFQKSTTGIRILNMPHAAAAFKASMLSYKYATSCGWYQSLSNATSVKEIFDIFNIKFELQKDNVCIPVIQNIYTHAGFRDMLKAVAPYMENGSLFFKDDYNNYFTINFNDGVVTGKRRAVNDQEQKPIPKAKVTIKTKQPQKTKKSAKKITFAAPTEAPVTVKRDNNTYTVQELVKELLKQMDAGNGNKLVKVDADFLFSGEKTA